jgi:hypothetical protein
MRVVVVSARCPLPTGKGDQVRAYGFIMHLSREHEVTVVTSGAGHRDADGEQQLRRMVRVVLVRPSSVHRGLAAAAAIARGVPAQVGWMMPRRVWSAARDAAADADVVLAMTSRSVRGGLPAPLVLDHVDALSLSMRRRARHGALPVRLLALLESVLLRRWERRLAGVTASALVTAPEDAAALPRHPRPTVMPVSIAVPGTPAPGDDDARSIDLVLTGNMGYPSNADAAAWLSEEIAPLIWQQRPGARIAIVGRGADRLRVDPRIDVHADVPDVGAFLRRAKLAVAPLRLGTGTPYKVLEALAAGAAVLATPAAVRPFGLEEDVAATGADAHALAACAVSLLDDPGRRAAMQLAAPGALARFCPERQSAVLQGLLAAAANNARQHAVAR